MVRQYRKNTEKTYLVLKLIGEYTSATVIAKRLDIGYTNVYYHFNKLIQEGYLNQDRTLTEKGMTFLKIHNGNSLGANFQKMQPNSFRWHNVRVRISIVAKGKDWVAHRHGIALLKNVQVHTINMGNFTTEQIVIDSVKVWVNPNAVILFMPVILGDDQGEMFERFLENVKKLVGKVEEYFSIRLYRGNILDFELTKQEWALVENQFAVLWNKQKKGERYVVFDPRTGKVRLLVDKSLGGHEFEAVDAVKSPEDAVRLQRQHLDIIEHNPPTNSELAVASKQNAGQLLQLAQQLEAYAVHLTAHVESVKQLGVNADAQSVETRKLREAVEELVNVVKGLQK